ncbi:MAG: hypothetical protein IT535_01250 [Bauldia sp.]|nr:hypothetical protein [Bauldia sp.]
MTSIAESAPRASVPSYAAYVLKAAVFVGLLWGAARLGQTAGALGAASLFLIVAVPILAVAAYRSALRRIHFLSAMTPTGRIARLLSGPYLRILFALPVALWSAASLVVGADAGAAPLWGGVILLAILVGLAFRLAWPLVRGEVQPWFQFIPVSRIAMTAAVGIAAAALLALQAGTDHAAFRSLAEAIEAQPKYRGSSNLMATLFEVMAIFHGLGAYALGAPLDLLAASAGLIYAAGLLATLYGLAKAFSAFVVPLREYARILAPPAPTESPGPVPPVRVAIAAALVTFVVGFIYFPGIALIERTLTPPPTIAGNDPPPPTIVEPVARARELMERIDDVVVRAGTIDRLEVLRAEILDRVRLQQAALEPAARQGFAAMRANVPAYLDAYYGLAAEYARLGTLLVGGYEEYVQEQLRVHLEENAPFAPFEGELVRVQLGVAAALQEYRLEVARLLAENEVAGIEMASPDIAAATTSVELLAALRFDDVITFPTRFRASVAVGAFTVGAVVAGKAVAKLAAKETLHLAAMALAKLAGGKLAAGGAGAFGGAVVGGFVGSVVPGAGTAAGAAIGGLAGGLLFGVGADYLLLKLEEELSRDEFQAQILAAIDEAETDFLAALR